MDPLYGTVFLFCHAESIWTSKYPAQWKVVINDSIEMWIWSVILCEHTKAWPFHPGMSTINNFRPQRSRGIFTCIKETLSPSGKIQWDKKVMGHSLHWPFSSGTSEIWMENSRHGTLHPNLCAQCLAKKILWGNLWFKISYNPELPDTRFCGLKFLKFSLPIFIFYFICLGFFNNTRCSRPYWSL